ncbi:MAG: lysophospholipase [Lachnospiraceae bacterium]|nr:lysophospholipase [Lachnospiraceae bacterium]
MVKREEFTYDSRDEKGTKIHAFRWLPETDAPVCIVQLVHGMAEYVERYDEFARYLAEHDIVVVGNDHLGHGRTASEGNGVYGYFCEQDPATVVVRDVHRLKKLTQEQYVGVPYIILGHSMGSFIVRNYLMRYGKGIDGAIILGTGENPAYMVRIAKLCVRLTSLFHKQTHPSEFLNAATFGSYLKRIQEPRTAMDWVCSDPDVVDKYMEDKLCGFTFTINGFQTLYELAGRCQDSEGLRQIPKKLPILLAAGADDPVGEYGLAPKKVYDTFLNLDMTKVQLKLYKNARHELLNETIRPKVYKDLLNWILAVIGS